MCLRNFTPLSTVNPEGLRTSKSMSNIVRGRKMTGSQRNFVQDSGIEFRKEK